MGEQSPQGPRYVPIRQSLHRQTLVLGAEREPIMLSALMCMLVGITSMTIIGVLSAILFWSLAVFFLRRMAKADPIMTKIWRKHIKQQDYYAASSSRWRRTGGFQC